MNNKEKGDNNKNITTGEKNKNVTTGEKNKNITTGEKNKNITTGDNNKNITTGDNNKNITTGEKNKNITTGEKNKNITTGEKNKNITTGEKNKNITTGEKNKNITTGDNNKNPNKSEKIRIVLENKPLNDVVIGIDLGTTNTCAAIVKNDKIEIMKNDADEKIIPSVVCYTENKIFVGTLAKNKMYQFPESTVFESKSLLGKSFKDCEKDINEDMGKRCHVKIIEDNTTKKAKYEVNIKGKKREYFPEQVSAEILKEIKKIAEKYNKNIKKAVITVPAHFKEKERKATIEAAKIAGLEVIQIINEPTAAAIAYGEQIESKSNKERTILIFDIGGGTFGFSIVKIKGNEYFVLGSDGEDNLGGENFTQKLMDHFIKEINNEFPDLKLDQNNKDEKSLKLFSLIKKKTEEVKNKLSGDTNALFKIEEGQIKFQKEININKYIELCEELWKKCINKVKNCIPPEYKDNIKGYINNIILIGGAAKTPTIKKKIEEFLGKPGLENINGDEAVAYGAAVAGNFIENLKDIKI